MSQSPELIKIQKVLAEQDAAHRKGQDETLKIVVAVVSVLISFISTNFYKTQFSMCQTILIKASLVSGAICLLLSLHRIYQNNVFVPKKAIGHISNVLNSASTPEEALQKLGSLLIDHSVLYKYSMQLIFATFCLSILTLVVSTLIS